MRIEHKVAVVTGGAIGIGRAIAVALVSDRCAPPRRLCRSCTAPAVDRSSTSPPPQVWASRRTGHPSTRPPRPALSGFTSTLHDLGDVRVNCLVPDWVATERVTPAELAADPPPIPLADVVAATLRRVRDEALAGRVVVLERGRPARLLEPH